MPTPWIQVRYLANPAGAWVNEHLVQRVPGVDWYALVLFEAFTVIGVLALATGRLASIGQALGRQHPRQDETLQFTRRNWSTTHGNRQQYQTIAWCTGYLTTMPSPNPVRDPAAFTAALRRLDHVDLPVVCTGPVQAPATGSVDVTWTLDTTLKGDREQQHIQRDGHTQARLQPQ